MFANLFHFFLSLWWITVVSDWHRKERTQPALGLLEGSLLESQPSVHRTVIIILQVTLPVFCGFLVFTRCEGERMLCTL